MAHEQRALERERHALDEAAGARLDGVEVGELGAQAVDEGVEAAVGAAGERDLGEEGRDRLGLRPMARSTSRQMTLPEPSQIAVERRLAVQARQQRLLDVAVAAQALERLGDVRPASACRPST